MQACQRTVQYSEQQQQQQQQQELIADYDFAAGKERERQRGRKKASSGLFTKKEGPLIKILPADAAFLPLLPAFLHCFIGDRTQPSAAGPPLCCESGAQFVGTFPVQAQALKVPSGTKF